MAASTDSAATRSRPSEDESAVDGVALEELLWALPRFVDRTSRQLELVRLVATRIPCLGSIIPRSTGRGSAPVRDDSVDVLQILAEDSPAEPVTGQGPGAAPGAAESATSSVSGSESAVVPDETELAVQDYDSLAASQVVPRLATLSDSDLTKILLYEQAHRNRQTILHRTTQLLAG